MADEILKPCPFCGVKPCLYWEAWKDISPDAGVWKLEANHKDSCYITHINGMNTTGRSSAGRLSQLVKWWNHREELFGNSEQLDDNISRQEALRIFEEHCYPVRYDHNSIDKGMTLPGIVEVLNMTPSAQPKWIPCSERLPYAEYGESDTVLTTCGYRDVEDTSVRWIRLLYFNGGNWCYPTGETYEAKVYAWMPLPEPWKGEEHGTSRTVLSQKPVR